MCMRACVRACMRERVHVRVCNALLCMCVCMHIVSVFVRVHALRRGGRVWKRCEISSRAVAVRGWRGAGQRDAVAERCLRGCVVG